MINNLPFEPEPWGPTDPEAACEATEESDPNPPYDLPYGVESWTDWQS
ncbi:hypothetical protein ACF082_34275 [Streptomyces lydicus]